MTTTAAPSVYVSGWCHTGRHDRCLGAYAGCACTCLHHSTPPPTAVAVAPAPTPARHCPTCTCEGTQP